jgi:hypothetical protein
MSALPLIAVIHERGSHVRNLSLAVAVWPSSPDRAAYRVNGRRRLPRGQQLLEREGVTHIRQWFMAS